MLHGLTLLGLKLPNNKFLDRNSSSYIFVFQCTENLKNGPSRTHLDFTKTIKSGIKCFGRIFVADLPDQPPTLPPKMGVFIYIYKLILPISPNL